MHYSYCPNNIESFVQKHWDKYQTFSVTENNDKEKYYCLSMMPYPSGNLHMGHVRNYTIGDVISRYQRMLGKNVLQPIGWDAFGLPAEQAAIINNVDPKTWTYSNIYYMRKQLKSLGFAYDWNREIITCQPKYYQWEQWFFTVLYNKGLVYKKNTLVNWCPYHNTVLANEQVVNDCCWRCQTHIEFKKVPQWFIKITHYADQLLNGLDQLQYWPDQVKTMQRNWIGRSIDIVVTFEIENSNNILKVSPRRLDTFMGITYLMISIDHPFSIELARTHSELEHFIKENYYYTEVLFSNQAVIKKQGVFINMYAIHPITKDKLPIWVTNFIKPIMFGGMGTSVGIPAHNQRDWEFAYQYNLPIKLVIRDVNKTELDVKNRIKIYLSEGILFNSGSFDGLYSNIAHDVIAKKLVANGVAQYEVHYRLKDWCISRQRYWGVPIPMVTLKDGSIKPVSMDQLPIVLPENILLSHNNVMRHSLSMYLDWMNTTYNQEAAVRDTDTFDTFVQSSWYYARYTCPDDHSSMLNPKITNYWLPVDQYVGGIEHAIMHLMYFRFYHKLMRDEGLVNSDEPAIRLLCQGMVLSDSFYYISKTGQRIWVSPDEVTIVRRNSMGLITQAIDIHGHNLVYSGMCKMSKSKNNGVDPSVIIKKYGADAVRFFIMFSAPAQSSLKWKESGIEGAKRFLKRLWDLTYQHIQFGCVKALCTLDLNQDQKLIRYNVYKTVEKVTDDIDRRQSFNTALAAIMQLVNQLHDMQPKSSQDHAILQEALSIVIRLLYPFTPHICFVLWKALGELEDIDNVLWPTIDTQAIQQQETLIIVQINGKKKYTVYVPLNSNKDVICKLLKQQNILQKYFINNKINKIIFIPNKVINFIIQ